MKLRQATAAELQAEAARALAADLTADGWRVVVDHQLPNPVDRGFRWDLYAEKEGETPRVYEFLGVRPDDEAENRAAQAARYAQEQGVRLFLKRVKKPAAKRTDFDKVLKGLKEIQAVLDYSVDQALVQRALITYAVIACSNLVEELLVPLAPEEENRRTLSLVDAARLAVAKGAISQESYKNVLTLQTRRNRLVHSNDLWEISKADARDSTRAVNLLAQELATPVFERDSRGESEFGR
ncbi:hypothetical protein [Variovorax sp.]|uniref:hypothetical protein n=1 Tax=Variovorax sp. TaxID=1871043 RepID=UPI0025FDE4F8|nr:hypothetical protein [Variovorax sp.]